MLCEARSPGIAIGFSFDEQAAEPINKTASIIISENRGPFNAANDDMLQQARDIESRLSWHGGRISEKPAY